jgi:hypothetical protein
MPWPNASEGERNHDENWIQKENQFARLRNLNLWRALHRICNANMSLETLQSKIIQNTSVGLTLARVISYRTALQAGHPASVTFAIGGIGHAPIASMLRKYGRLIHYSEKSYRHEMYRSMMVLPIKPVYRTNKFF